MYYPIMLDLKDKKCLVVGGGSVATRKIRHLLDVEADVHIIAKNLTSEIQKLVDEERVKYVGQLYDPSHINQTWLVFAATNDNEFNQEIAKDCEKLGVFCNCVTSPELGSFIVPAYFRKGKLTISVATSGIGPALAAKIRDHISEDFGDDCSLYVEFFEKWRKFILSLDVDTSRKHEILRKTADFVSAVIIERKEFSMGASEIRNFCERILHEFKVSREYSSLEELWNKLY